MTDAERMTRDELNVKLAPHFGWEPAWSVGKQGWREVGKPWMLQDDPPNIIAINGPYIGEMFKALGEAFWSYDGCENNGTGEHLWTFDGWDTVKKAYTAPCVEIHDPCLEMATGLAYLAMKETNYDQ